jgi:hypothetical protein
MEGLALRRELADAVVVGKVDPHQFFAGLAVSGRALPNSLTEPLANLTGTP